jgi:hypothetical protein
LDPSILNQLEALTGEGGESFAAKPYRESRLVRENNPTGRAPERRVFLRVLLNTEKS